jgi:hypothetical protein
VLQAHAVSMHSARRFIFDTPQAMSRRSRAQIDAVDSVKEDEPIEHAAIRPEA